MNSITQSFSREEIESSQLSQLYSPNKGTFNSEQIIEEHLEYTPTNNNKSLGPQQSIAKFSHSERRKSKLKKHRKSKGKKHGKGQMEKKKKSKAKPFKVNPMYASRISEMLSQISVPTTKSKMSSSSELMKLESRISTELLALRQQKIYALSNLNRTVDKKNRAIELIKEYSDMKETSKSDQYDSGSSVNEYNGSHYRSQRNEIESFSKISKNTPEIRNPSMSRTKEIITDIAHEAETIKKQIMGPLNEHPLLVKNRELKEELESLNSQFGVIAPKIQKVDEEIESYKHENAKIQKQIQRNKSKLSELQKNRFETFFPKDRKKLENMNALMKRHEQLLGRRESLGSQVMNGTIIRKAQDEILIEELKEENKILMDDCERLLVDRQENQLYQYSVQELENRVQQEERSKRLFYDNLSSFRANIANLEAENRSLRAKAESNMYPND